MIKNSAVLIILFGLLTYSALVVIGNILSAQTAEPPVPSALGGLSGTGDIRLRNINNQIFTGSDFRIDENGQCVLQVADGEKILNCRELLDIEFTSNLPSLPAGAYEITLNNRDIIYGIIKESRPDAIAIQSNILGDALIKFEHLLIINLKNQLSKDRSLLSGTPTEDEVYFLNGDRDAGIITAVQPNNLTIKSSLYGKERTYQFANIWWVAFAQLSEPSHQGDGALTARLICQDGSRLTVQIQKAEQRLLYFKFNGQDYRVPFDKISYFYFKNERCVYLSDLEPVDVKEYPSFLTVSDKSIPFLWPYQKDKSVYHKRTSSLKNKKYYKGLGVHANSELTYALNGRYRKFFVTVGLDDESGPGGSVNFIIYLDGKKLYPPKADGIIKWGDEPKEVVLDVTDVKEIKLVVNDGEDYYVLDRAVWAGARLIK
ncbi:MAG: NPCBM/NEW2 domain-containing protein [Planctomycetota bacterium]